MSAILRSVLTVLNVFAMTVLVLAGCRSTPTPLDERVSYWKAIVTQELPIGSGREDIEARSAHIFLALGALTTASSIVFSTLGWLTPYAWRVLLWGTVGFVVSNALLFALLYRALTHVSVSGVQTPNGNAADALIDVVLDVGPLVVSAIGIVGGSVLGFYLARRCMHASPADNEKALP